MEDIHAAACARVTTGHRPLYVVPGDTRDPGTKVPTALLPACGFSSSPMRRAWFTACIRAGPNGGGRACKRLSHAVPTPAVTNRRGRRAPASLRHAPSSMHGSELLFPSCRDLCTSELGEGCAGTFPVSAEYTAGFSAKD